MDRSTPPPDGSDAVDATTTAPAKSPKARPTKRKAESAPRRSKPRVPAVLAAKVAEDDVEPPEAAAPERTDEKASNPMLRRGDLLTAVAARSALPKSDLRAVMDVLLDEMGRALDSGHDLALPPLGRVKAVKRKTAPGGGDVLTLRLRRKKPEPEAK